MDAPCKIQGSIHVFRLVNNMCPGKWVHIIWMRVYFMTFSSPKLNFRTNYLLRRTKNNAVAPMTGAIPRVINAD